LQELLKPSDNLKEQIDQPAKTAYPTLNVTLPKRVQSEGFISLSFLREKMDPESQMIVFKRTFA
jgi:hypothetical protein